VSSPQMHDLVEDREDKGTRASRSPGGKEACWKHVYASPSGQGSASKGTILLSCTVAHSSCKANFLDACCKVCTIPCTGGTSGHDTPACSRKCMHAHTSAHTYTYINTRTYTQAQARTQKSTHTYTHICTQAQTHTQKKHTHTCTHTRTCTHAHTSTHTCMHAHTSEHTYAHLHACTHTRIQTRLSTHINMHRHTSTMQSQQGDEDASVFDKG